MAYEQKSLARQKVQYNNDNTTNPLTYQLVVDGVKVTPTSATIAIYRRGNSTALVSATAMTLSGSLLTYALDTTTTASYPIETGYRGEVIVTYSSDTYNRTIIFDIVRWLLDLSIGVDQLIDIDERAGGMAHNGDDDLAGPIVACRAIMQARIEAKVLEDKKMVENMILDQSHVSVCGALFVLAQLFFEKGDTESYQRYNSMFDALMASVLNTIRYDDDQDGDEDSTIGGVQEVRLET